VAIHLALALTFFHFVGINAARVVLTLYALALGAHASSVGVVGGMFYLFPLLLSWPIGAAADRLGSRGLLLAGAVIGAFALLLPYFFRVLSMLYVAAALSGLALAFFHVTLQNLIGILSKPEERARNFSNFSLVGAVTNFVGPLIAGFSIDHFGHAYACLSVVALAAAALGLLLVWGRLLPGPRKAAPPPQAPLSTLIDRDVMMMLATSSLVQLGTDVFQFYLPIYGHAVGLSATAIGAVLASFAAASFVVRAFLARLIKDVGPDRLLMYAFAAGAAGFMLIPLFESVLMLAAVAFLFGLGMGCGIPLTVILMFSRSTEGRSGQTLGMRLTANNFVRTFGPMVFGAIGSAFGLWPVFVINSAMMVAGAMVSRSATRAPPADEIPDRPE
jgi:Arabinose efflux permease